MAALVLFVMTLPYPVAFNATEPEPDRPTVNAMIPALDNASTSTAPPSE